MKAERTQIRYDRLEGWVLDKETQTLGKEEEALWTVFELADHLEACELVHQLGQIAHQHGASPELDVRRNLVFVRVTTPGVGLTEEDFDFAEAVDLEIGSGQKAAGMMEDRPS